MENSNPYYFIEMAWQKMDLNSWQRINEVMYETVCVAIKANMSFKKDDFESIVERFSGYRWFGCNNNGKGYGESFYRQAKTYNNASALQSYEKFLGIKPFILDNKRVVSWDYLTDNDFVYEVTGFNDDKEITLVAYQRKGYPGKHQPANEKGKRKLFKFNNKEWLVFRKNIILFD